MVKFFRLLARLHYWQRRAARAERRIAQVELEAKSEVYRNRNREDYFVSAAVMGGRGIVGIPARTGPAYQPPKPQVAVDPWDTLTEIDRMEFEAEWRPHAEAAGVSLQTAKQKFYNEVIVPRRRPLNDDPYSGVN